MGTNIRILSRGIKPGSYSTTRPTVSRYPDLTSYSHDVFCTPVLKDYRWKTRKKLFNRIELVYPKRQEDP